ncbi:MAG TPA: SprT-like domain-containing protein [Candidatus Scatovivens faecipullorum]|nr:SprT-like domain-containing protein [Candidatus Scatovivens faecipullorum]
MQEKLYKLFKECKSELKSIGINIENKTLIGDIDISISKRSKKRYACCKQEEPDESSKYVIKRKIYFSRYKKHHIEVSKWVLELKDEIIKNTIMHELIHCLPNCSNHGKEFKNYANLINEKLDYNITRLGNKAKDYKLSNLEYFEENNKKYKYIIKCQNCNTIYYRQRLAKNFFKKYRCGICKGELKFI